MLRAPIWITSATSTHVVDVAHVHQLGDDRQAGLLLRLLEQRRPSRRGPGSCTARCAACTRRRAASRRRCRRRTRATSSVWSRLSTVHGPAISAKLSPPTLRPSTSITRPLALAELRRGELVRLQDRDQVVHARRPLEARGRDPVAVADRPDHGQQLAPRDVGGAARPTPLARRPRRSAPRSPPLSSRSSLVLPFSESFVEVLFVDHRCGTSAFDVGQSGFGVRRSLLVRSRLRQPRAGRLGKSPIPVEARTPSAAPAAR